MSKSPLRGDQPIHTHIRELIARLLSHIDSPELLPDSVGIMTLYGFTQAELMAYARRLAYDNNFWLNVGPEGRLIRDQLRSQLRG